MGTNEGLTISGWWEGSERERGESVRSLFDALVQQAAGRLSDYERWFDLYCGRLEVRRGSDGVSVQKMPVRETRAVIDTQVARLTRYWARPMHVTDDGDYVTRIRATRSDQFVEGVMQSAGYETLGRAAFLKAAIAGVGGVKVIPTKGSAVPELEHVAPHEVLVDEMESLYGAPRTMVHWRLVDRRVEMARYPEKASEIARASRASMQNSPFSYVEKFSGAQALLQSSSDLLLAIEAWHLPSDPAASEKDTDGRHVIAIDGVAVADAAWTRPRFPIALMRYQPHPLGWWGAGVCDLTYELERELAQMVIDVRRGLQAHRPHLFVREGVNVKQMTNELLGIWKMNDPQMDVKMFNPGVFNPEFYGWLERTRNWIWEIAGVSRMSGQQVKPTGLESGRSLRVWQDVESERHLVTGRAYEQLSMDVAQLIEDEVRAKADAVGAENVVVRAPVSGTAEYRKLTWNDVALEPDCFTWKVYPVSAFATSPAARMEQVYELLRNGAETGVPIIAPEDLPELLDMPDIRAYARRRWTDKKVVEAHIARMLHDGEYVPPSEFLSFPVALDVARKEYVIAQEEGAPEDRKLLVLKYIQEVQAHMDKLEEYAQRQAQQMAAGASGYTATGDPATGSAAVGVTQAEAPAGEVIPFPTAPVAPQE